MRFTPRSSVFRLYCRVGWEDLATTPELRILLMGAVKKYRLKFRRPEYRAHDGDENFRKDDSAYWKIIPVESNADFYADDDGEARQIVLGFSSDGPALTEMRTGKKVSMEVVGLFELLPDGSTREVELQLKTPAFLGDAAVVQPS